MKVIPKILLTKKEIKILRETSRIICKIQREISKNPSSFQESCAELENMVDNCIQTDISIFRILTCNEVIEYIDY